MTDQTTDPYAHLKALSRLCTSPPPGPCANMSDAALDAEIERLGQRWDQVRSNCEGMSGSPGEGLIERLGELEHEREKRRGR